MGTRSLIAVQLDGEYKIAQYSQWDGYPDGQGMKCLNFLREEMVEQKFKDQLRKLRMVHTKEELNALKSIYSDVKVIPEFDRDTGADILKIVQDGKTVTGCVANNIGFAADTEFFGCEYVWVIDLDQRMFEVYFGYNDIPLHKGDRFYFLQDDVENNGYFPARIFAAWSLNDLPTKEEFLKTFREDDDDDAAEK
jgi:hypothetical protein